MNSFRLLTFVGLLFSWMASTNAGAASGTINFHGAIVEGPCEQSINSTTVNTQCYRGGNMLTSRTRITNNGILASLPGNVGSSQFTWINRQRNLGLMTVSYR